MSATSARSSEMTAAASSPAVSRVEVVRATPTTSLVRVDLENAGQLPAGALLVVRGVGLARRIAPLPTPADAGNVVRLAFAVPGELREGRLALQLADREIPLQAPPERTREDAVAAVQLQRARRRLAELEAELQARDAQVGAGDAAQAVQREVDRLDADDPLRARLEQQLAQHRLLRAQLARELEAVRARAEEVEAALEEARSERDRLEEELAVEQHDRADEHARLGETIESARSRVKYLETRLVELQGRSASGDGQTSPQA